MEQRRLGRSEIVIPRLMFGGNVFGWTVDTATSHRLLDALMDAGLTAIDTADMYSTWVPGHVGGESETVIGEWLNRRGNRNRVTIATKVGMDMGSGNKGLGAAWIARAVEDSLRRLQTDHIDLYQTHKDDETTPLEETLRALARLVEQGKVRAIGASNYSAPRFAEALAVSARLGLPRFETMQPLYNLMERAEFEAALGPLCVKEEVGVIPYSSLASGFLTGKYRTEADLSKSARGIGVAKYLQGRGPAVLAVADALAARLSATPAQVALAWLMARPGVVAPIASATSVEQLHDLVAATGLALDSEAMAALDQASA